MDDVEKMVGSEVDKKIAEYAKNDADKHRKFLETMFQRITWAIGLILILVLGAGTWLFGKSVENATKVTVSAFLTQDDVPEQVRSIVTQTINASLPQLKKSVGAATIEALQEGTGKLLTKAVEQKIDEIKKLKKTDLIQAGLQGKRGVPGPIGPPGIAQCRSVSSKYPTAATCDLGEIVMSGACSCNNPVFLTSGAKPIPRGYICNNFCTTGSWDWRQAATAHVICWRLSN